MNLFEKFIAWLFTPDELPDHDTPEWEAMKQDILAALERDEPYTNDIRTD